MRLKTIAECDMEIDEREGEIPVSFEEYQSLKAKVKELQDLVNKRAAVGMAQVRFPLFPVCMYKPEVE